MKFLLIVIIFGDSSNRSSTDHIEFAKLSDCNRAAMFYMEVAKSNYSTAYVTCREINKEKY
jgi:hypothetical protein